MFAFRTPFRTKIQASTATLPLKQDIFIFLVGHRADRTESESRLSKLLGYGHAVYLRTVVLGQRYYVVFFVERKHKLDKEFDVPLIPRFTTELTGRKDGSGKQRYDLETQQKMWADKSAGLLPLKYETGRNSRKGRGKDHSRAFLKNPVRV